MTAEPALCYPVQSAHCSTPTNPTSDISWVDSGSGVAGASRSQHEPPAVARVRAIIRQQHNTTQISHLSHNKKVNFKPNSDYHVSLINNQIIAKSSYQINFIVV